MFKLKLRVHRQRLCLGLCFVYFGHTFYSFFSPFFWGVFRLNFWNIEFKVSKLQEFKNVILDYQKKTNHLLKYYYTYTWMHIECNGIYLGVIRPKGAEARDPLIIKICTAHRLAFKNIGGTGS